VALLEQTQIMTRSIPELAISPSPVEVDRVFWL
jgi:hypothetical protein